MYDQLREIGNKLISLTLSLKDEEYRIEEIFRVIFNIDRNIYIGFCRVPSEGSSIII